MYNVSNTYKELVKSTDRIFEPKIEINDIAYIGNEVIEFNIEESISNGDELLIGTINSTKLTCAIKTPNTIPKNAKLRPHLRMINGTGYTEWLPLGEYYIDDRNYESGVWNFTCYDKLILANQPYVTTLVFPETMENVLNDICLQLELERDASVVINPLYQVPFNYDYTISDVLRYIAASHCGSFRITKDGKLGLVRYDKNDSSVDAITPTDYSSLEHTGQVKKITKIVVTYNDDGEYLEIGSGIESNTMKIHNAFITEPMLNTIFNKLNGFTYKPYNMTWKCFPYLEIGDCISIIYFESPAWSMADIEWNKAGINWEGTKPFKSLIMNSTISFKGGLSGEISAQAKSEKQSEFKGTLTKRVENLSKTALKEDKPYYGVTVGRANGIKINKSDNSSGAIFNSDKLAFTAGGQDKLYFDPISGKYKFVGDIIMEGGSISWDSVNTPPFDPGDIVMSYEALTDKPYIPPEYTDTAALAAWKSSGYATYINDRGVYTGTLVADNIITGTLRGVNINVSTDVVVGDTITLGNPNSNHLNIINDNGFRVKLNNSDLLRFYSNALWCNGDLSIAAGKSIGVFTGGLSSPSWSSLIGLYQNQIDVFSNGAGKTLNLYGYVCIRDRFGLFGTTPVGKQSVNYPNNIVTTQTSGSTHSSNEQNMLNNLKADVNNLRSSLYALIQALKIYGQV